MIDDAQRPIHHFNHPELTKELQHEESDSYYAPQTLVALLGLNSVVLRRQFMPPFMQA